MTAEQVVAESAGRIGEPDRVVEMAAALRPFCAAHAAAGVGDGEHALPEEKPDPDAGGAEAECGPFVRHGRLWGGLGSSSRAGLLVATSYDAF